MQYTKNKLYEHLLNLNIFKQNNYFELYLDLIYSNINTNTEKFKTQKHHIIPQYYFNSTNQDVDDSENNTVILLFKDHILAHYYLAKCSINQYRYSNEVAVFTMIGRERCNIDELMIDYDELQLLYEEFCEYDSIMNSGENNGNFGHYWTDEQKLQASIDKKKYYQEHPELRLYLSELQKGKEPGNKGKKAFYNINGKCIYADSCPDGYTDEYPEYLKQIHSITSLGNRSTSGMLCYTNGVHNTCCFEGQQPEGYYLGKTFSENVICGKPGSHTYTDNNGNYHQWYDYEVKPGWYLGGHSINVKGEKNPMFGKHQSEESKRKSSEAHKGLYNGEKNPSYGKHWYHDGFVRCYIKGNCPIGFQPGYKRGEPCLKSEEEINNYIKEKNYCE